MTSSTAPAIEPLRPEYDGELTACVFCKSEDIFPFDRDYTGRDIYKCRGCGVKFLNPQYTDEYLARFYAEYLGGMDATDRSRQRFEREKRLEYLRIYLDLIEKFGRKGRWLSVGCGDGLELELALEQGWKAEGYDVDPECTRAVANRLGVVVQAGDFLKVPYEPNSFQCIYLHHVIEHPKNPDEYLQRIHDLLAPDGILFLATPNIGSVSGNWKTLLGKLHLKKRRGKHYDAWHHLFYYTPTVMKRILERQYGFEVVYYRSGAEYRPHRSRLSQYVLKHYNVLPFRSTFVMLARKTAVAKGAAA